MPLNLQTGPYYDDYNEAQQFYKILFRPGYAVQARELTQLATILEEQIRRFGKHIFQEGSMVIPGQITYDQALQYVKVDPTFSASPVNYDLIDPLITGVTTQIRGVTTGLTAQVVSVDRDLNILYVKYVDSGTATTVAAFSATETLKFIPDNTNFATVFATSPTGTTASASIPEGVYFIFGRFVKVFSQTIIVSATNPLPSARIGLQVVESLVTPEDDQTLQDNAAGTPNYAAPGAHRYKIDLVLTALAIDAITDENFVELLRVQAGIIQKIVTTTLYSEIEKTLARRTEDTNGSFTVRPFKLDISEHLLEGINRGIFTVGNGGDADKLAIGIEPGKAYVLGHEIENIATQYLPAEKARDTAFFHNNRTRAFLGNFVYINRLFGLPTYDGLPQVNLYDAHIVSDGVAPVTDPIGTATIRGVEFSQGSFAVVGQPGPIFKAFLADINITEPGKTIVDVRALAVSDGTLTTTANVLTQVDIVNVSGSFVAGSTITALLPTLTEVVYAWDTSNNMLLTLPTTDAIANNYNISSSATGEAVILNRTVLFDTEDSILAYQLPQSAVSTVRDRSDAITTTYSYRKVFSPATTTSLRVTFAVGANEVFEGMGISDYVATIETGSDAGELINVVAANPAFASALTQLSFDAPAGTTVKLSATVVKEIAQERTKTLVDQSLAIASAVPTTISLGRADVYSPIGIWEGTDDTGDPIDDRYFFDTGQRDGVYDFGSLTLKPGKVNPTQIYIEFQYFTHGAGDYFCVNSYNGFGSYTNWYERIPHFVSRAGDALMLRDCLDFRPRVDDSTWPPSQPAPAVPVYGSVGHLVKPNDDVTNDFSYYLARMDKLYLDGTGDFKLIKGSPSLLPVPPADPKDGMVLATLRYGAYTFGPKDVYMSLIDNRRYTMRDIGKLDRRISNLEYYTALNLLEKETASFNVPDGNTGLDRFKSGFMVDPFNDLRVADAANVDSAFALDGKSKIMRPQYNSESVDMGFVESESADVEYRDLKPENDVITLPYTETPIVTQDKASRIENLNPYNVFNFTGTIKLDPATDTWKDTEFRPDIITTDNSVYDAVAAQLAAERSLGTVWNEWTTDWVGVTEEKVGSEFTFVSAPHVVVQPASAVNEAGFWSGFVGVKRQTIETHKLVTQKTNTSQSRTGITTTLGSVTRDTVDDRIVSVALVPYIRSREVSFVAKGLRPTTRYYAFFDNLDVNAFCTPGTLTSDANGKLEGVFTIPNPNTDPANAFRVGARVFRLCDDSQNRPDVIQTFADATYNASGLLESHQKTITSVREPVVQKNTVTENKISTAEVTKDVLVRRVWIDPLAQSFLVDTLVGGYCATSVDVFFKTKDAAIPVTLQIREMDNGMPTQRVIPFSTVVLNPDDINISDDAATATNFKFESPVYLQQGGEYAIVLLSNSNNYYVWTAAMGDKLLNSDRFISQVPYAGVLFKSQNASTWSPAQGQALKFTLNRAVFNTGVIGEAYFQNPEIETRALAALSLQTYNTTNTIRVYHPDHGMPTGSKVTITIPPGAADVNWAATYNGIAVSHIVPTISGDLRTSSQPSGIADTVLGSRTYTVGNPEVDSYTITIVNGAFAAVNATSSGRTGIVMGATQNRPYDVMMPLIGELNFQGTATTWYRRSITSTSVHGGQVAYERDEPGVFPFTQFIPNQNVELDAPRVVASLVNETNLVNLGSAFANKSLVWFVELTSVRDNLSPMIDTKRTAAILVNNRIDYRTDGSTPATSPSAAAPNFIAETAASGATGVARYVTRAATLANQANSLHVLVNIMWPVEAQVDVYYRILPTETYETFGVQPYVLMTPNADTDFATAQSATDFRDYYWTADGIGNFTTFAIKVVMRSTNSSRVPLCKDFRAIALET